MMPRLDRRAWSALRPTANALLAGCAPLTELVLCCTKRHLWSPRVIGVGAESACSSARSEFPIALDAYVRAYVHTALRDPLWLHRILDHRLFSFHNSRRK